MHTSILYHIVCLLHVATTVLALLREVHYRGWTHPTLQQAFYVHNIRYVETFVCSYNKILIIKTNEMHYF
jgi:hypothetical protein